MFFLFNIVRNVAPISRKAVRYVNYGVLHLHNCILFAFATCREKEIETHTNTMSHDTYNCKRRSSCKRNTHVTVEFTPRETH